MKEYSYSLYDKSGRIISPDLFSKAKFISLWYGKTRILTKDSGISDYQYVADKKLYFDSIIDYFEDARIARNKKAKARKKPSKPKTKRIAKVVQPEELEKYLGESDYTAPEPRLKKSDFEVLQYKKVVEPKNVKQTPFGKFELVKTSLKFKELRILDPNNEAQLKEVIQDLKDLYRMNIYKLVEQCKKLGMTYGDSYWFITRISIPKVGEKGELLTDKLIQTYDLSERFIAERRAEEVGGEVIERKDKLEVVKKKDLMRNGRQATIDSMLKDKALDASGIGSARTKISDARSAEMALDRLMDKFEAKAVDYVSRAYAIAGIIGGLEIEFISKTNL